MKTYKGFNKDLKCRDFQYEIGKTYEMDGAIVACERGFHACENPLDIFAYYPPSNSVFYETEQDGDISKHDSDSKIASSKITIKGEINLLSIAKIGVEWILSRVDFKDAKELNTGNQSAATNTGYQSAATNTGDKSAATNTGNQSAATNTGNRSAAIVEGNESIAISIGYDGKAMGKIGCWIVLTEWNDSGHIINCRLHKVDGKTIKPDVFYTLKNNKFIPEL